MLGRSREKQCWVILPIALIPELGVSSWLSWLLGVPYYIMAGSLLVGQVIAGMAGALLLRALWKIWKFE